MKEQIRCAIQNLGRKRARTILTVFSIAIGVMSVILIAAISEAGKNAINAELDNLGLGALSVSADKNEPQAVLTPELLKTIRAQEGVTEATPVLLEPSKASMRGMVANAAIWGVDAGTKQMIALKPQYGTLFSRRNIEKGEKVCLLDSGTAEAFYCRENIVGKKVRLWLHGQMEEFSVIGIVQSGGNVLQGMIGEYLPFFVYVPYTTLQRLSVKPNFDQIAIRVEPQEEIDNVRQKLQDTIERKTGLSNAFKVQNIAQQKDRLNHLLDIVTVILSLIAGISLIVSGLGIMTIMLVSVQERTREIGIKKAVGASRKIILAEFLIEALAISISGSAIGVVAGVWVAWLGCTVLKTVFSISWGFMALCVLISIVIGTAFGVYPSAMASRLSPVEALRSE